jgi:type II secretory pathway component GspD/PulD (secretin)
MSNTKRGIKRFLNIALLLLPLLLASVTFGGEPAERPKGKTAAKPNFVLTVKDNLISLKAKDVSLKEVLEEIGRRMNIEVLALLSEQEKITLDFEKLPLEEAIERLIRNYPHLIVSQEGDRRITRIVALQKSGDPVPSNPVVKDTEAKKQETPIKLESRMREQAVRKESPPPEPFRFQFDPSQYGQKRR